MEIKNVSYYNSVPQFLKPKLNYFLRDFLNDYSDYLDEMEAGETFDTEVEYEGDLELYFVKFSFSKAGTGFLSDKENQLFLYCDDEFCGVVYME